MTRIDTYDNLVTFFVEFLIYWSAFIFWYKQLHRKYEPKGWYFQKKKILKRKKCQIYDLQKASFVKLVFLTKVLSKAGSFSIPGCFISWINLLSVLIQTIINPHFSTKMTWFELLIMREKSFFRQKTLHKGHFSMNKPPKEKPEGIKID